MCLIAFAWNVHPDYRLILAANRDEFHDRPSEALARWSDKPGVLAGRDGLAGGTWLGIGSGGRVAAVTNVRTPAPVNGPISRGALPVAFLQSSHEHDAASPPQGLAQTGPCNLLFFGRTTAGYHANHPTPVSQSISSGVHALSNAALNTPWPKVERLKAALSAAIESDAALGSGLLTALADEAIPPDDQLPDTGIGLARERSLAPAFIRGPVYGTRASTLVCVRHNGHGCIIERRFGPDGAPYGETALDF